MEPIAIVGIGCRFPGARDSEAFWQLLRDGIDAITEVPIERWDLDAFYHPDVTIPGKMNTRWGGFLEQVDRFDFHFFKILPWEAVRMDPQQRLLLEVAWEALEDAGQVVEHLAGTRTGVFIGIGPGDYGRIQVRDPSIISAYTNTGNLLSIAANRISYLFDFRGPSMSVDTACSSSLVAVHLACQSLWSEESTLALAGGVNLLLLPELTIGFSKARALSPDGRCKAFDARANGYVRGEGAGLVVLKPLLHALADRDPIYAVIRGSAVNNDGRTNGLTAPNRWAQEAVLQEAYQRASVSPGQVQYVEAHGSGTPLGDSIEAMALGTVLAIDRLPGHRCAIGSVKTNVGHLETAAGIAGLIKVALSLKHRMIPPSLHFHKPNPHIPFDELPLYVQQSLSPWPEESRPALAGVSAFGFGGTNVHVVLEEAPQLVERHGDVQVNDAGTSGHNAARISGSPCRPASASLILPLSARSPKALQALAQAYQDFLTAEEAGPTMSLQDLCYTASVRRTHHPHRVAFVFHAREELINGLKTFLQDRDRPGRPSGRRVPGPRSKLVFIFPGQGFQRDIGRELLEQEPVFLATLQPCDELFRLWTGRSLLEEFTADSGPVLSPIEGSEICNPQSAEIVQATFFALQVGLAALWRSWGIEPDAIMGHGVGEVAAAHMAGALNLKEAMKVIFQGGRWTQSPSLPLFLRNVGRAGDGQDFHATCQEQQLKEPDSLASAIQKLVEGSYNIFLELSPHPALSEEISQCLHRYGREGTILPSFRRGEERQAVMLESLSTLYTLGYSIDWGRLYPTGGRCVRLPSYPWQREPCWLEPGQTNTSSNGK